VVELGTSWYPTILLMDQRVIGDLSNSARVHGWTHGARGTTNLLKRTSFAGLVLETRVGGELYSERSGCSFEIDVTRDLWKIIEAEKLQKFGRCDESNVLIKLRGMQSQA